MTSSRIPDIKELMWDLLVFYLENYKKNFNIFDTNVGKNFLSKLITNDDIKKYQWKIKGNFEYSLLDIYCKHFLESFILLYMKEKHISVNEIRIPKKFIKSKKLREVFDSSFKELEDKVLLCDEFEYSILIPTFRIYFPEDSEIIKLDSDHLIKNIYKKDYPYGKKLFISKFKEAPKYWFPYGTTPGSLSEANASIEVKFRIKKRKNEELPYIEREFVPFAPFSISDRDPFDEKVLSIHDFFLCFSKEDRFRPFTYGQTYYIKLPPFSQNYEYFSKHIGFQFSYPAGLLDLKNKNIAKAWLNCWQQNYNEFYNIFYKESDTKSSNIFRYSIETIRTLENIPYLTMQNFLLVSTLEGLLYVKSVKNKLKIEGFSKKHVMSEVFTKISANRKKKWRFLVSEDYFKDSGFDQENHDKDIKNFIISAYQYRNNIAHPEEKRDIDFKPQYFYDNEPVQRYENILAMKISEWFKKFSRFLLNTWVNNRISSQEEWYKYIEGLF